MLPLKKVTKTQFAENDLIDIWLYFYFEWGESLADEYLDQLNSGINSLLATPEIGIDCHYVREGYRRFQINRHLVFYQVKNTKIVIVRVLHKPLDTDMHF